MSISYTWGVANLDRETATGKVNTVHYTISATDGTYNSSAYGSIGLDGEITIPYGNLTEEICVGWVQNALAANLPAEDADSNPIPMDARRADAVNQVESALAAQISEQAAPTRATGTPW
jgi:hypothetical protein